MKILNIENSETDFNLMLKHLELAGFYNIISERVDNEKKLRMALLRENWSLVISECNIQGLGARDALSILRENSTNIPFIVMSENIQNEIVKDLLKEGIEDFVSKTNFELLPAVIKRAMREFKTNEQEAKSRSIAKKAIDAKEEMLAIVYHDIKNPLAALQLDAQLLELLSYKTPNEETISDLRVQAKRILRTVDGLKFLVSEILENSKPISDAEFEHNFIIRKSINNPLNVLQDVLEAYQPLINAKKITISKKIKQTKVAVSFDRERVYQVISNLLSNAIKFSPLNGEIIIELDENEKGESLFTISDNGPGISEISLSHIFEKYSSGRSSNGKGLYICKSIVESHGGEIYASTLKEGGAKFWFYIPVDEKERESKEIKRRRKKNNVFDPNQKNVYIIDDDEDLREIMAWAVEKEGYRVFSYGNAKSALDDLQLTAYPPGLIILDFHMDNMNGKQFLDIKEKNQHLMIKRCPVLMVSAASLVVRELIDPSLYSEVLLKPFKLNNLVTTIQRYL